MQIYWNKRNRLHRERVHLLLRGGGGERGGLFNIAKRITGSKNTVVRDGVDLRVVQATVGSI